MARIRIESDDEELPTLAEILRSTKQSKRPPKERSTSPAPEAGGAIPFLSNANGSITQNGGENVDEESSKKKSKSVRPRQRILRRVENNSVLLHPLKISTDISDLDKNERRRKLEVKKLGAIENQSLDWGQEAPLEKTQETKFIFKKPDNQGDGTSWETFNYTGPLAEVTGAVREKAHPFKIPPPLERAKPSEAPKSIPTVINSHQKRSSSIDHAALLI
jgi:hypothetical protein